jgi:uncharacterized protein YbjT (DUF2867 family)
VVALMEGKGDGRVELAGPDVISYEAIVRIALRALRKRRVLVNVPRPVVRAGLEALERVAGTAAFATWEEAELLEMPMVTPKGTSDAESLGVKPLPMRSVLGG